MSRRGMSPPVAVVILVVVLVVTGLGGYFGLQAVHSTTSSNTTCSPPSACAATANDVSVFVAMTPSYGMNYTHVYAGQVLGAQIQTTGSETVQSYKISWGDGTSSSGASPTLTHSYPTAGLYVMDGSVTDTAGGTHTGTAGLFPINVGLSYGSLQGGTAPQISTSFTNGTGGFEPWVTSGAKVTVSASYTGTPATPGWTNSAMTITAGTGAVQDTYSHPGPSATGSYTLTTPGTVNITLHGGATGPLSGETSTFTYTWAVYVAPSSTSLGCKYCTPPGASATSPHPGKIVNYEVAPGGAVTLDPAFDYYTIGVEVSENVFQYLIAYNGTDVGITYPNFVPQIATCVPGSPQCTADYGTTLVSENATGALSSHASVGHYYTFVVANTSHFYDSATKKSWSVYPSDIMYSYVRQLAFSDLPAVAVYPGWIVAQALLPNGNPNWDGGTHYPYNNTPENILGSMLINDSAYCPASAMTNAHGCITFHVAGGNDNYWPGFLAFAAHGTGGAIVPTSWYMSQQAVAFGFPGGASADSPSQLIKGVTSTNSTAWQTYVKSLSPTSWDAMEGVASTDYPVGEPNVGFNEVGSGPYYLESANPAIGYVLQASPAYQAPIGCAGQVGCEPAPGAYPASVTTYWEDSDTAGLAAIQAGQADFSGFETSNTATMLGLVQKGVAKFMNYPTTSEFNFGFNTNIDLSTLKTYDPYPVNIKADSLSYIGLRGFLAAAYPAASVQAQFNQIEGVQYQFNFGGFIPQYMGAYYPTNITWPNYNVTTGQFTDPVAGQTAVGSASWYWSQLTNPSSPIYDPQFGSGGYSSSNPLHIPALYFLGDPTHQSVLNLWGSLVSSLSGGAVVFDVYPVSSAIVYSNLLPNGQCPWAMWFLGWAADYEQPYDYWAAYGAASGTWSAPNSYYQMFTLASNNNAATCGHANASSFADLQYWASQPYIPQACQGVAYQATLYWANYANTNPNVAQGVYEWNQISAVYNLLNLYVNTGQSFQGVFGAPWINLASMNSNTLNGWTGQSINFWSIQGNGVVKS